MLFSTALMLGVNLQEKVVGQKLEGHGPPGITPPPPPPPLLPVYASDVWEETNS